MQVAQRVPRPGSRPLSWLFCQSAQTLQGPYSCSLPGNQPRVVLTISTSVPAPARSTLCNLPPVSGTPGSQYLPGPGSQGLGGVVTGEQSTPELSIAVTESSLLPAPF